MNQFFWHCDKDRNRFHYSWFSSSSLWNFLQLIVFELQDEPLLKTVINEINIIFLIVLITITFSCIYQLLIHLVAHIILRAGNISSWTRRWLLTLRFCVHGLFTAHTQTMQEFQVELFTTYIFLPSLLGVPKHTVEKNSSSCLYFLRCFYYQQRNLLD